VSMKRINSKLGISPVSMNVIDSVVEYSTKYQVQLMLIASRNQIDTKGGYVGLTSKEFTNYAKAPNIILCRDHSGASEKSLMSDLNAGFDLIHVDCNEAKDVIRATKRLLLIVKECDVLLEVGTEDNTGISTDIDKFFHDLEFITDIVTPEFIVGGTGSLVKEIFQVGCFDYDTVTKLVSIAHSFGVKFKEHNVDYTSLCDLRQRLNAGVDAINIGPELGVAQTKIVIEQAQRHGISLNAFLDKSLQSGKWFKWLYGNTSDALKAVTAGHYVFNSDEYKALIGKLNLVVDINREIKHGIFTLLDHYVGGLDGTKK